MLKIVSAIYAICLKSPVSSLFSDKNGKVGADLEIKRIASCGILKYNEKKNEPTHVQPPNLQKSQSNSENSEREVNAMIQSLIRAIDILEALKEPEQPFSLARLSEELQLPPSTIHRILQTFCSKNYVTRDEKTHLYQLGPALISLGMAATHNVKLQNAAPPVLRKLSAMTGEDAFLVILSGYKGLVLEKVEGPNNLKVIEKFGSEIDLHCGAIRKSLLAFQPESFWHEFVDRGLRRHSDNTITDPDKLIRDLEKIRREGIAVSRGEYIDGAVGVGAPVFGLHGTAVASMGLIAPSSRINEQRIEELRKDVKQCASELSYMLGYVDRTNSRQ